MKAGPRYRPGRAGCRFDYHATGEWNPISAVVRESLVHLPSWVLRGEDGTEMSVWREVDELIGSVRRRDGVIAVAYGDGDDCAGPIVARQQYHEEPTEVELRVINRVLRPLAVERPWADLLAEMEPCDHDYDGCVQREGRC